MENNNSNNNVREEGAAGGRTRRVGGRATRPSPEMGHGKEGVTREVSRVAVISGTGVTSEDDATRVISVTSVTSVTSTQIETGKEEEGEEGHSAGEREDDAFNIPLIISLDE